MDGCLICGAQHAGSCNPQHPAHRPLSAEEWAERAELAKLVDLTPLGAAGARQRGYG